MSKVKELKLSFVAVDENNLTIAETWLEKIDRPWMSEPDANKRVGTGVDRRAVKQMKRAAVEDIQEGSPRYTTLYVFSDGSGLWEKRQDDWFLAEKDTIARAHENN
jgi:hypothetical protein